MAEAPYIVKLGSSNEAGFLSLIEDVPIEDMTRWLGSGGVHPPIPPTSAQRPYEVRVPGARMLTPRRPYSHNVGREIVGIGGGPGTLDYAGAFVDAPHGSWVYVRTNQSHQGALARVRVDPEVGPASLWPFYRAALPSGSANRVLLDEPSNPTTLLAAWPFYRGALLGGGRENNLSELLTPDALGSWGTVHFLLDSQTIGEVSIGKTKITRAATSAAPFGEEVDGRDVVLFFDQSVRRVVSHDDNSITVDQPVNLSTWAVGRTYVNNEGVILDGVVYVCRATHTSVAGINDPPTNPGFWRPEPMTALGFCILTGANACETIDDLADPAKCTLTDLGFYLDEKAPVYLRGDDWNNYDATPFQNPRIGYFAGPTVNDTFEVAFHVRSELEQPLTIVQLGISASMVSPFLQGAVVSPEPVSPFDGFAGWFHDILSLDFHPSSPSALWVALKNKITCAKLKIEAEGNTPKCVGVFINLCDNDPADAQRVKRLGANLQQLMDALWSHIGDSTVPTILTGPSRYGGVAEQRAAIYAQLNELATTNKNVGVADTRQASEIPGGVFVAPDDYAVDLLHYSALGQVKKGRVNCDAWKLVRARLAEPEAEAPTPTPTPAEILARIRRAILESVDVLSFPGPGGQITLNGPKALIEAEKYYASLVARQSGLRRTLARFR